MIISKWIIALHPRTPFTGKIPEIALNLALLKGCSIVGVFWGNFTAKEPAANAGVCGCEVCVGVVVWVVVCVRVSGWVGVDV